MNPKRRSIARQAALRLIFSLGLFVVLLGASSYGFYSVALQKSAHERAEDLATFFQARLMQLDRDWELQARDFKVRLEVTRLLEEKKTSITNLQAFMTVQGTNRRFQYMLIQNQGGAKVFAFGSDLDLEKIPIPSQQESGWYFARGSGNLYRVYVVPIWLGVGTGRMAVFYKIDNSLLFNLATPGIVLTAKYDGSPVASSAGQAELGQAKLAEPATTDAEVREIPWSANIADKTSLIIDAPIKVLFTRTELAVGAATIPVIDGLILWFTLGFWLMRNARRIRELGGAVDEFTAGRWAVTALENKLHLAHGGQPDEISEVADAIEELMRTVKRGDAALARQMDKLKSLNAELNEFTYIASHDLQEPLRKLVIFSEWLVRDLGEVPERAAKDLAFITDAARRMRELVQELLNLSRAGNRELQTELIGLEKIVDNVLESLALDLAESGAVITREPLPEVMGDATLLTQLYQNLIGNALKYTEAMPPRIHLDATRSGGEWVLGVRDNGIGINPEYVEQIFQPFKRLHGQGKFEGTGIGLAICRKAAERHHGRIWVESEEGKGAYFRFALPCEP